MAAPTAENFPVSIRKLFNLISPSQIHHASYSVNEGVIVCVLEGGDVIAVSIQAGIKRGKPQRILQEVYRIHLSVDDRTNGSKQGTKLMTLNKDCSLTLYHLSEHQGQLHTDCIAQCSTDQLQAVVKGNMLERSNIHIVGADVHKFYVIIAQFLIQVTTDGIKDPSSPISRVTQLHWNPSEGKVVHGKAENGLLILLHATGNITTHLLNTGQLVGTVVWVQYFHSIYPAFHTEELKSAKPAFVDITQDLQYLIITFHETKYSILKISLNQYFQLFPSHHHAQGQSPVHRHYSVSGKAADDLDEDEIDNIRGGRPVDQMGAPGNRSWRNLLTSAKEIVNRKSRSDVERTKSVWKVIEESGKNKNWFDCIQELQSFSKQQASKNRNKIKRTFQQDSQITTALKKRKTSRDDSLLSRSTTLNISEIDSSKASYVFKIPKPFRDKLVGGVSSNASSVLVWYKSKANAPDSVGQRYGGVCIVDVETNTLNMHNFTECTVVAGSDKFNHPPLLISMSDVQVLACDTHQETLVNMLMIYKSASVAETLCLQNSWDHCSIPIHALEVGLRHRQLDTVAFFLKSRENVLQVHQPTSSPASSPTLKQPSSVSSDLTQLWLAVDLLMASIRDNIKEPQSRQYSMQLLHLTLGYQTRLIQNAVEGIASRQQGADIECIGPSEEELSESLRKLIGCVAELRLYLKECPQWLRKNQTPPPQDETDGVEDTEPIPEDICPQDEIAQWNSMPPQDVIKEAILSRRLPLLQAYLHRSNAGSVESTSHAKLPGKMSGLISTGLDVVLEALLLADLDTACGMLQNMGYNVNAELKKICLFTANSGLRDFLINHLSQLGEFSQEEEEAIAFVHQLERLYACQSFEKAKSLAVEGNKGAWSDQSVPNIPVNAIAQEYLASTIKTGELVSSEAPNCENFNYAHIILDWVKHWDQETRERILIEKLLSAKNKDTPVQFPISQESMWNYLTVHSEWAYIEQLLQASFPSSGQPSEGMGWNPALPQTMTPEAADQLQNCTSYLRERILNELARRGIFSSAEFGNLKKLVYRLGSNCLLFSKPSALPSMQQEGGMSTVQQFNQQFMEYCLKERLPSVLYLFLDYYKLCQSENDVINMELPFVNGQWLEMMLHFRWVARQVADPSLMFQASLSNGRLLLRVAQPSVTSLLEANQPIVALATLMYAPGTLSQAMTQSTSEDDKLWKVLPLSLKHALKSYPKLQAAIFAPQDMDGINPQDITVYQLLQGNAAFDPAKLFQWQHTNNTAPKSGKLMEMQHFSQPDLVRQFAYHEDFKFSYYLYQGRPSFAFVAFLASQLREDGTISRRRISHAYIKAYTTALRHFTNHSIAAACVAFVEMLGRDSLPMRIDLQAAITIMNYEEKDAFGKVSGKESKAMVEQRLVSDLMLCLKGSRSNAELLADRLSTAITAKLLQDRITLYHWDATSAWVPAILYSRLHKLPLPTAYLDQCALNNQWLYFTCFVQAHQYPKDQVLELVRKFESATVREHLQDAFENLQYGPGSDTGRPRSHRAWARDVRSQYYLKMGMFRRSRSNSSRGSLSEGSDVSEDSTANVSEDYASLDESSLQPDVPKELDITKVSQDLFAIIFSCNSTEKPWKTLLAHSVLLQQPVLAVIASCYQDSQIVDCLATWLLTSMSDQSAASKVTEHVPSLQWHSWSLLELREIIVAAVETGDITLLVKGFFTFDQDCTLNHLLSFCECFIIKKNFALAKQHLKDFHTDMLKCRRQESIKNIRDPYSSPDKIQGELQWCQDTACHIVEIMFAMCQTNWDTSKLLQLLAEGNFSLIISRPEPDYVKLHKICQMLQDTNIQMNIKALLKTKVHHFKEECQRVAEVLQQEKLFSKAKELSELCGLPSDQVVVNQLQYDLTEIKKSRVWTLENGRITFWRSCHMTFKKNKVQGKAAHDFFMSQVSSTATPSAQEMVTLLTYAHQWLAKHLSVNNQGEEETRELQELEHKVWQWKLKAEVEKTESPISYSTLFGDTNKSDQTHDEMFKSQGASELLYVASHDLISSQMPKLTDEKEISALNRILSQLLENGCIIQGHRLATQFQHPFQDLSIILTCIQLALGKKRPSGLSAEMQSLLKGGKPQMPSRLAQKADIPRRTLTKSMSLLSISSFSMDQPDVDEGQIDEVLNTMQNLSQECTGSSRCCSRIINAYAIAKVLRINYEAVVTSQPFDILKSILISTSDQRFTLARTFIRTNGLKDTEVAGFLSDIVISGLQTRTGRRREAPAARPPQVVEISADREEFSHMIRLCKDPAILGNRLLEEVNQLASSDNVQNKQVLTMRVELIIRAHDCHTLCCNTEGICSVLRVCRDCSAILQQAQEFTHLARLLIGVGRYSEMTYIFDTLRAHQQIEMLLRRGTKDDKLKVALLDYLKRCDPPDTETYNVVAVKFEMNREIGELVEKDARQNLKSLSKKVMDTNIELQNSLQAVLQDFTKAAQHYAKDNCLRHAERCVKQARLVALQLHLLPMKKRVINLEHNAVAEFVAQHPKFYEAYIVSKAYRFQTEWSGSVYYNVVEQGDLRYFEDLRACMPVSDSIFTDVAARFKRDSSKSSQATTNMKSFLGCCQDVLVAYKIATELGFPDVAGELLEGESGAYLRDVA